MAVLEGARAGRARAHAEAKENLRCARRRLRLLRPARPAEALGKSVRARRARRRAGTAPDALQAFGARAGAERASSSRSSTMRTDAVREWLYVVRGLPDEGLLVAADYARRRASTTARSTPPSGPSPRHDFGLRYLTPFREQFAAAAREHGADEATLFDIARQESRFVPDIASSAGAVGLMQLMPPTARWVAKQLNRADYRPSQISGRLDQRTAIRRVLLQVLAHRLERLPALAAAAYNAGPGRAQAWLNGAPLEGAI